jgi:hypothetical protein
MSHQHEATGGQADGEQEAAWLLLAVYRGHWEINDYPGSRVLKANCGHLAWLSPQGERYVDEGAYLCCMDCGDELFRADDKEIRKQAVAGAVDHIQANLGQPAADFARTFMRRHGIRE